jgi:hypothetical protein
VSDEAIAVNELLIEKITAMIGHYPAAYVSAHIDSLAEQFWLTEKLLITRFRTVSSDTLSDKALRKEIKTGLLQMSSPELRSLLQCDPSEALTKIQCPVFALNGEKDLQVSVDMNFNHLFQHAETGAFEEYGAIEEILSPEVQEDIAAWIRRITKISK